MLLGNGLSFYRNGVFIRLKKKNYCIENCDYKFVGFMVFGFKYYKNV